MTAITEITAALPADYEARADGWTADRQRTFVEAIAEGHSVSDACRLVGMTKQSAYAFRKRAAGAAFALGWSAANLLARDTLADALLVRALEGQVDTYTRADGETWTRHRHDNRLATTMLARLDRAVESAPGAEAQAARLVAREFDGFLDLLGRDAAPARAGLFLAARAEADAGDLEPVAALTRTDRWLKARAGVASDVDTADLDPDARASWTAGQWVRAEAAGLVALAPDAGTAGSSQSGQLRDGEEADDKGDPRVWWDEKRREWRTDFPPPPDFIGVEYGEFGDCFYERQCSEEEAALLDADFAADRARRAANDAPLRDATFADLAAELAASGFLPRQASGDAPPQASAPHQAVPARDPNPDPVRPRAPASSMPSVRTPLDPPLPGLGAARAVSPPPRPPR